MSTIILTPGIVFVAWLTCRVEAKGVLIFMEKRKSKDPVSFPPVSFAVDNRQSYHILSKLCTSVMNVRVRLLIMNIDMTM